MALQSGQIVSQHKALSNFYAASGREPQVAQVWMMVGFKFVLFEHADHGCRAT
jgi:hypothetical protein